MERRQQYRLPCVKGCDWYHGAIACVLGPQSRVLCISPAAVATDFIAGRDRVALQKTAQGAAQLTGIVEPEDIALSILTCVTHLKISTGTKTGRFLAT